MRGQLKRLHQERGVAAVEFALILPVVMLILFGILEFGRVWSQYQVFQGAAREGARCAAVKGAGVSSCVVQTQINNASRPYTPQPATVQVVNNSGGVVAAGTCTTATRGMNVRVSWVQPLDVNIPFWRQITLRPTVQAVFRCE
jgi:Flp pilus assembly protein TadG